MRAYVGAIVLRTWIRTIRGGLPGRAGGLNMGLYITKPVSLTIEEA